MGHVLSYLGRWEFDPVLGGGILLAAAAYVFAAHVVTREHPDRPWPRRATGFFLSGLALLWLALLGPVGAWDDVFFWSHMTQHLVVMMAVAPLLLLGSPVLLVLRVSRRSFRARWVVPVLRSRVLVAACNPVFGWLLFSGVIVVAHFSPFYNFAVEHPMVHRFVEHPLFLGTALVYYYPLIGTNSAPHRLPPALRLVSMFLVMVPETMTGFFIFVSGSVRYPWYAHVERPFGPNPLVDQQLAGSLMWVTGMVADVVWMTLAARDWLAHEAEKAKRIDAQVAAERLAR